LDGKINGNACVRACEIGTFEEMLKMSFYEFGNNASFEELVNMSVAGNPKPKPKNAAKKK